MTPEQEAFLIALADKGLAEEAAQVVRNNQILLDIKVDAAKKIVEADLKAEAQALIDAGLLDFEVNVKPGIV